MYLMGHAGDELCVDRVGRATDRTREPSITLNAVLQPALLDALFDQPSLHTRGFLARLLISVPRSLVGYRTMDTQPVTDDARESYYNVMNSLLEIPFDPNHHEELHLSQAAIVTIKGFQASIEPGLRDGGTLENIREWASKLPGAIARISGILHCIRYPVTPWSVEVAESTVADAIQIGKYFQCHAHIVFDDLSSDSHLAGARHILGWIKKNQLTKFSESDAQQKLKRKFRKIEDIKEPLAVLVQRHYIRPLGDVHVGPGRPKSPQFSVNPALLPDIGSQVNVGPTDGSGSGDPDDGAAGACSAILLPEQPTAHIYA